MAGWHQTKKAGRWILIIIGLALLFVIDDLLYFLLAEKLLQLHPGVLLQNFIIFVLFCLNLLLAYAVYRTMCKQPTTGREGMIGLVGSALTTISPEGGWVMVHGERWQAYSEAPVARGRKVRVVQMGPGLILKVVLDETPPRLSQKTEQAG